MLKIKNIKAGSIASELGLKPGDMITSLNGAEARDILDYSFHCPGEELTLGVTTVAGEAIEFIIEKDYEEDLGVELVLTTRNCTNKCIFCFIDQQPPNLRPTLYIKDDDYRLSFLEGNYITTTNFRKHDCQRITSERLSPLYISVHATNPVIRAQLLGKNEPSQIMDTLHELTQGGVSFHCQIVLCPGINDGEVLKETLRDLATFGTSLLSLAVVPVGLTKFRENLPFLHPVSKEGARQVIATVAGFQIQSLKEIGRRTAFAADEFYLIAELPVPGPEYYEDYPQLENGVGMIRKFLTKANILRSLPPQGIPPKRLGLITGMAAYGTLTEVGEMLENAVSGLSAHIIPVENSFLGPNITVAGLLAGADIMGATAPHRGECDVFVIPESAVRAGCFIDDWTRDDLARNLDKPVVVAAEPSDIVKIAGGML